MRSRRAAAPARLQVKCKFMCPRVRPFAATFKPSRLVLPVELERSRVKGQIGSPESFNPDCCLRAPWQLLILVRAQARLHRQPASLKVVCMVRGEDAHNPPPRARPAIPLQCSSNELPHEHLAVAAEAQAPFSSGGRRCVAGRAPAGRRCSDHGAQMDGAAQATHALLHQGRARLEH